jgi:very-short-patch-repair endonuclease
VALEVDGREFHELQFEKDRRRANNHTVAGTQLLTVTPTMIERNITEVTRWIRMIQNRQ